MEQENGTGRTEPSFGEDEELNLEDNRVDLEKLFDEIDQGSATPFSAKDSDDEVYRSDAYTASSDSDADTVLKEEMDEPPFYAAPPKQPLLDFGETEEPPPDDAGYDDAGDATTPEISDGEESMSRGVLMVGGAMAALGILLGAIGIYAGFSASSRIDALQQSVDSLQEKLATALLSGDPRVGQLQAEQAGLVSRLDEMALKIDTLATQPQKGNDPRVAELTKRLEALERKSSSARTQTSTATQSSGGSSKTTTTTAKPAASGDWAVILLSTASVTQADSERTRLQKMGYRADVIKSQSDGKLVYRVRVLGYSSQEAAKAAIPAIEKKSGIHGAWVAKK